MQLAFYNNFTLGVINGNTIIDASKAIENIDAYNPQILLETIIADWATYGPQIREVTQGNSGVSLDSVSFCPAVPRPGQLVCLAGNYIEPERPDKGTFNAFLKANTSVMGNGATIELPPTEADVFHFEPELALIIGKRASKLSAADAMDHIFACTQFIDVSARGLPGGFFLGKSWHTFGPIGPALVTLDELGDPNELPAKLWVNDTLKHDFSTNEMARKIPEVLEEVTKVLTLEPGDVVSTGTHHYALSPIQDGDKVCLDIEKLGPALTVNVRDDQKRTWER